MALVNNDRSVSLPGPSNSLVPSGSTGNMGRTIRDLTRDLGRHESDVADASRNYANNPTLQNSLNVQRAVQKMTQIAELASAVAAAIHNAMMSILKKIA